MYAPGANRQRRDRASGGTAAECVLDRRGVGVESSVMLRLRVHGVTESTWRGIARRLRLRGELVDDDSYGAVAFVDSAALFSPKIEEILLTRRHVLLAGDGIFELEVLEKLAGIAQQK